MLKRVVAVLAMLFGSLGVIACGLGVYAVWLVGARLDRANDRAMAAVDRSLTAARDRVLGVQQRVQEAKLTTDGIGKNVRDWTAKQATEVIVARLEIESKADKLAQHFQQADLLLETSTELIRGVQQLLEASNSVGDVAWLDDLLERLLSLRSTSQQAKATVDGIREFTAMFDDAEPRSRALQLIARVIVMNSELETRLGEVANRFAELQTRAEQMKARTSSYILCGTIVGCLLFAWMAAGQAALCVYGWKNCRRSRAGAMQS